MADVKKLTKRDYFGMIRDIVSDRPDLVAFVDHELELLARKNSGNSQTKVQVENEKVAQMLVQELKAMAQAMTITDLMTSSKAIQDYVLENGKPLTNQKISAIFKQLVDNGILVKVIDKKKSYFSVAN